MRLGEREFHMTELNVLYTFQKTVTFDIISTTSRKIMPCQKQHYMDTIFPQFNVLKGRHKNIYNVYLYVYKDIYIHKKMQIDSR